MTPHYIVVDLFCGAGGVTIGFEQAELNNEKIVKIIAAVNHDPKAIESHWKNHPEVIHYEEDIRTLDLTDLRHLVLMQQNLYPSAKLILWASLECTNFSKAKGGQPRDADSRTLADHLHRYVEAIHPDYVMIENVVEFMSWGPLDEKGKPISKKAGIDYVRWRNEMNSHGYNDEWKTMNSADFGARTSRNRLFGCFYRPYLGVIWPNPTHAKNPEKSGVNHPVQKWLPCRPCLNLEEKGKSIFRDKPLSDRTYERIFAGLIKYVAGMNQKEFISKYYSGKPMSKNISIDGPAGTIRTSDAQAIVQPEFILSYHHSSNAESTNVPSTALTVSDKKAICQPEFLMKYNSMATNGNMDHSVKSTEDPSPTIPASRQPNLVSAEFISNYHGTGDNASSTDQVFPSILAADIHSIVSAEWIDRQFSNGTKDNATNAPMGAVMPVPKANLVQLEFLMDTQFNNVGQSPDEPLNTITANRKWHYLMNPQYFNTGGSVDQPCFTLIARMDKMPPYLVTTESGHMAITVYNTDSLIVRKIKWFMAAYGIIDIKMRMLFVEELKKIQGFPTDYVLIGTQADQKKFIGNSVVPLVVKTWIEAMAVKDISLLKKTA